MSKSNFNMVEKERSRLRLEFQIAGEGEEMRDKLFAEMMKDLGIETIDGVHWPDWCCALVERLLESGWKK